MCCNFCGSVLYDCCIVLSDFVCQHRQNEGLTFFFRHKHQSKRQPPLVMLLSVVYTSSPGDTREREGCLDWRPKKVSKTKRPRYDIPLLKPLVVVLPLAAWYCRI